MKLATFCAVAGRGEPQRRRCPDTHPATAVQQRSAWCHHDQDVGIGIVLLAMEQPLREIVANADIESSMVLNRVNEGSDNYGYNAQSGEYGDMIVMGILDLTKEVRVVLQSAASDAGLMITTEAMIAEIPQKSPTMHQGMEAMEVV